MELNATELVNGMWSCFLVDGELEQVEKKIKSYRSNDEVISFIRGVMEKHNLMKFIKLKGDPKSNAKAIECRKRGNKFFHPRVRKYIKAVELYNESIALAEENSEALATAYANRSAICFELAEYEDCLENIQWARENNYPINLLPKLDQREKACKVQMYQAHYQKPKIDQPLDMKLSYKPNPKIPHIAECLELIQDEKFGRGLITNRDLNVGDIIAFEKPYVKVLEPSLRYMKCDYCYDDKFLTLRPCKGCTLTMFCSEECQLKAMREYHQFECPILCDMQRLVEIVFIDALRLTIKALTTFNFDLEELNLLMKSGYKNIPNALELDWNAVDPKEIYETIYNLETHSDKRSPHHMAQYASTAIIMSRALLQKTKINNFSKNTVALGNIIQLLIMHHAMLHPVNGFGALFRDYEDKTFKTKTLMKCVCPILSLANHSCAPNVQILTRRDGKLAAYVHRPIKKGFQITIYYNDCFTTKSLEERRQHLSANYFFECQCEACTKDYPLKENLKLVLQEKIKNETMRFCKGKKFDTKNPDDMLVLYLHLLNKFDHHFPCLDIEELQTAVSLIYCDRYWYKSRKMMYKTLCNI